ncbi:MAG: DNA alkylation repair protein [Candidatus Woesearchaeota archaeon]
MLTQLIGHMQRLGNTERAHKNASFFKTKPGEYGYADIFWGISVPVLRKLAREYVDTVTLADIEHLLYSKVHEQRFIGLVFLVMFYKQSKDITQKSEYVSFYLAHAHQVNNWDLVDTSAPYILGAYVYDIETRATKHVQGNSTLQSDVPVSIPQDILYVLAKDELLWKRRIAIVATWMLIRKGITHHTFALAVMLLDDTHDLMHKAVGWMLREAGKKDEDALRHFLDRYNSNMPRTMLRYAIERLADRKKYLLA